MTEQPERISVLLIDIPSAMERLGGDESFLKELLHLYKADFEERFALLRKAVEGKDFQAVREIGHTLKGSSADLSLLELQAVSRRMELAGRDSDSVAAEQCLLDLEAAFGRLKGFIDKRYPAR